MKKRNEHNLAILWGSETGWTTLGHPTPASRYESELTGQILYTRSFYMVNWASVEFRLISIQLILQAGKKPRVEISESILPAKQIVDEIPLDMGLALLELEDF